MAFLHVEMLTSVNNAHLPEVCGDQPPAVRRRSRRGPAAGPGRVPAPIAL